MKIEMGKVFYCGVCKERWSVFMLNLFLGYNNVSPLKEKEYTHIFQKEKKCFCPRCFFIKGKKVELVKS